MYWYPGSSISVFGTFDIGTGKTGYRYRILDRALKVFLYYVLFRIMVFMVLISILPIWYYLYRIGTRTDFTYLVAVLYWYSCRFYLFNTRTSAQKNKITTKWYQSRYRTKIPVPVPYQYMRYGIWYPVLFKFGTGIFYFQYRYGYCTNLIPRRHTLFVSPPTEAFPILGK
ncbi:hypothetical protein Hdeb2414_s0010g00356391 [Helianthus debilis subsp. tardiflorus]